MLLWYQNYIICFTSRCNFLRSVDQSVQVYSMKSVVVYKHQYFTRNVGETYFHAVPLKKILWNTPEYSKVFQNIQKKIIIYHWPCLSFYLSFCLFVIIFISFCLSSCLFPSLYLFLSLLLSFSISFCLFSCLFPSLYLFLSLLLSFSISLYPQMMKEKKARHRQQLREAQLAQRRGSQSSTPPSEHASPVVNGSAASARNGHVHSSRPSGRQRQIHAATGSGAAGSGSYTNYAGMK